MPTISVFFGIVISMYVNDHTPPHFHVRHGEFRASVPINRRSSMVNCREVCFASW